MGSKAVSKLQSLQKRLKNLGVRKITDSHTHAFDRQDIRFKARKRTLASTSCQHYPIERNLRVAKIVFSSFRKGYTQIVFGLPAHNVNVRAQNDRILNWAKKNPRLIPLALVTPKMTTSQLKVLVKNGFSGFKPYPEFYSRFRKKISIEAYLTKPMLEIANKYKLPIVLHSVPDASTQQSLNRIIEMAKNYPNINFVLAHMGRSREPHKARILCDAIKGLENVSLSTSITTDPNVFKIALRTLGHKRVIFGSDFPWGLLEVALKKVGKRHGSKEVPERLQGMKYLPKDKYKWASPELINLTSSKFKKNIDRMIVSNLEALTSALEELFSKSEISEREVRMVFSGNANRVFKRRMY
jgi:predicted TIM-barrel fold metal-dependent hydrolase